MRADDGWRRATVIHIGARRHKTTRSGPVRCAEKNGPRQTQPPPSRKVLPSLLQHNIEFWLHFSVQLFLRNILLLSFIGDHTHTHTEGQLHTGHHQTRARFSSFFSAVSASRASQLVECRRRSECVCSVCVCCVVCLLCCVMRALSHKEIPKNRPFTRISSLKKQTGER